MEYLHDDDLHDALRAHFQTVDVVRLHEVLLNAGIVDDDVRRKILDDYFFDAGQFFDNGWFEAEGRKFAPGVYFEEGERGSQRTGRYYLPGPSFGTIFHEFSHGTVALLFQPDTADALRVVGELGGDGTGSSEGDDRGGS
jgi:hypothetical protein